MPKIIVEVEWDTPEDLLWLNADNVALALHAYCKNTKFKVQEIVLGEEQPEVPQSEGQSI